MQSGNGTGHLKTNTHKVIKTKKEKKEKVQFPVPTGLNFGGCCAVFFSYLVALTATCFLSLTTLSQSADGVQVVLSVKWSEGQPPHKYKFELQRALQTWANKNEKLKATLNCKVSDVTKDGEAVISISPAPGTG